MSDPPFILFKISILQKNILLVYCSILQNKQDWVCPVYNILVQFLRNLKII